MILGYYFSPNLITKENIVYLNKNILQNTTNEDNPAEGVTKICEVFSLKFKNVANLLKPIIELIDYANINYFNFEVYPFNSHQGLNYNIYTGENKGRYDYHIDMETSNKQCTAKLTCIINLSEEDYTGGDFFIFDGKETCIKKFKPGSLVIFPSFFPHKVSPVLSGKRKTLSIWQLGPWWH
jgi:hypothetical protein